MDGIELDPDRAYALLIMLPSAYPIDFRDAEAARISLMRNVRAPLATLTAKTLTGHSMVAWQCAGKRGLISQTGESTGQATRMILHGGWGITPFLSVFHDGKLVRMKDVPGRYRSLIAAGSVSILAIEVSKASCLSMRRYVARFVTHPSNPKSRFGLLLDPERFEGGGCASFALSALRRAGLFAGHERRFRRKVRIYEGPLGRRVDVPEGVDPFVTARRRSHENVVSFYALRAGPWDSGKLNRIVEFVDPELLYAALGAIRERAGEAFAHRGRAALSVTDPVVRRVRSMATRWAVSHYRLARFTGARKSTLVLEWR